MLDRACGLVGSSAIINYSESCGQCHVGNGLPFPDPSTGKFTVEQKWGIDCLICHAAEGQYDMNNDGVALPGEQAGSRVRAIDPITGKMAWHQDRTQRAAESVGGRVDNDACLRCHHHGQADYQYKRGTPYEPEEDVHAAAGVHCTDCHLTSHHKIARGSRVTDMFSWERQDVDVRCENCHKTNEIHASQPKLNDHLNVIGCETCHIPEVSGAARRIWGPTYGATGPEADVPVFNNANGKWEPYTKYDASLHPPVYRWFNGGTSMLAEPVDQPGSFSMQPATRHTAGAKILPFRSFISGQPMDGRGLPGTPQFDPAFTMKGALDQMAPALKQMGLMRPEGMTEAESGAMSQFPNMLLFDRADYFANGNVSDAISIGMARMGGLMQGIDTSSASREALIQMGSMMWSGQIASLDLPNNPYDPTYVNDQDPTTVTGSYITVSHAIKRVGALTCTDCHAPQGRLDFKSLGYTPDEIQHLTTMFDNSNAVEMNWQMYP